MFLLEPDDTQAFVDDNGTLVVAHDAGFFSCCTIRLRKIIQYYQHFGRLPHVDSSMQWSKYKDRERDVTHEYFMPYKPFLMAVKDISFTSDSREDQFSDYRNINYTALQPLLNAYFFPSQQVVNAFEALINKYNINPSNTIAVLYRGNDKRKETPPPSYDSIIYQLDKVVKQNPEHTILIQTDEIEFFQHFKQLYPKSVHFHEATMVHQDQEAVQNHIDRSQSITHAVNFLSILLILSRCKHVVTNSGNVSMWLCLYRGSANNVHQFLDNQWLSDTPQLS